jgi:hypothetical protein
VRKAFSIGKAMTSPIRNAVFPMGKGSKKQNRQLIHWGKLLFPEGKPDGHSFIHNVFSNEEHSFSEEKSE